MKINQPSFGLLALLLLTFILFLTSCTSTEISANSDIDTVFHPTKTNVPIEIKIPSSTPVLQFSPPQNLSTTQAPGFLPGTENSMFPIPDDPFYIKVTPPTPISPPSSPSINYQLKDWTSQDAFSMIQLTDQYAYVAGVNLFFGGSYYPSLQNLVSLSIREAEYRFSDEVFNEELEWKKALAKFYSMSIDPASYLWIKENIEDSLNTMQSPIDNIGPYLHYRGFNIVLYPIDNIRGNGETAYIMLISPYYGATNQNLLLIAIKNAGKYELSFFPDEWPKIRKYNFDENNVQDQDGDGIPEIIIQTYDDPCKLRIMEWQTNQFVDLSNGNMYCMFNYEFDPPSFPEIDLITSHPANGNINFYWIRIDNAYQLVDEINLFPFEEILSAPLTESHDYLANIEKIQYALDNWENLNFSSAHQITYDIDKTDKDIWRLNLGFNYLLSNWNKGLQIIQEVADSPFNPEDMIPSKIAKVFLENFSGKKEQIIPACRIVADTYNSLDYKYLNYFCHSNIVMEYLVNEYAANELSELKEYLDQFSEISQINFEINGRPILLLTYSLNNYNKGSMFIYQDGNSLRFFHPVNLPFFEPESLSVESLELPGIDEFVYRFNGTDDVFIIKFNLESVSPNISVLLESWKPEIVEEIIINGNLYYHVLEAYKFSHEDICEEYIDVYDYYYYWNSKSQLFEQINILEYLLFEDGDFKNAITLLQKQIETYEPYQNFLIEQEEECGWYGYRFTYPNLLYLLGLAYELNGDTDLAIQTYYNLWQQAPESGYALMARSKLVDRP